MMIKKLEKITKKSLGTLNLNIRNWNHSLIILMKMIDLFSSGKRVIKILEKW